MAYVYPVRVIFPDKRLGRRYGVAVNPRLVNGQVVANINIDGQVIRAVLHEESGEYVPCDKDLKPVALHVESTSRIRHKTTRLGHLRQ